MVVLWFGGEGVACDIDIILIQYNGSGDFENVWNDLLVLAIDGKYLEIHNHLII